MFWLFTAWRELKKAGILGINRRNAACILDHNPRRLYPTVDDKLRMHELCQEIGVPAPDIYEVIRTPAALRGISRKLAELDDFVIKPNRGSAGRGVLVITGRAGSAFLRHNGQLLETERICQHVSDTLSGKYSLGGRPDVALVQQRIDLHPGFRRLAYKGIPDIRIILPAQSNHTIG